MVYITDLQQLVSIWLDRMNNPSQPQSYKDALNECVYDLNKLINVSLQEEADYQEAMESMDADMYLATLEAHERVA